MRLASPVKPMTRTERNEHALKRGRSWRDQGAPGITCETNEKGRNQITKPEDRKALEGPGAPGIACETNDKGTDRSASWRTGLRWIGWMFNLV